MPLDEKIFSPKARRWVPGVALAILLLASGSVNVAAGQNRDGGEAAVRAGDHGSTQPRRVRFEAVRTEGEIDVDGHLDEEAWSRAIRIPLPYETSPGDNDPAPVATACFVTYDDARLYFGCRARDPEPGRIRAYVTDRDDTRGHDRIWISVDPFNDARRAFEFAVTALGVQHDQLYDGRTGMPDDSWDAIWRSDGRITDEGYVVEASIPFKSLRFPGGSGVQTWGFHARREWPRSDRVVTRSMRWNRSDSCLLCQANLLTGISGVSPGLNAEVAPTLTARRVDDRVDFPDGELRSGTIEEEVGIDARWSVTPDLALNATVNPDFSQVEADAPQLDANTRFTLSFPEKRPFFLEGADIFSTPLRAVFTRTIADPSVGGKVTGKTGAHSLGLLVARDERTNLLFPGALGSSTASLDESSTTVLGRYRRDIGGASTAGVLYTGREGAGYHNRVAGADVFFRPGSALRVNVQYLHSDTRYPSELAKSRKQPDGAFGGDALHLRLDYFTRRWNGTVTLSARSPDFRADAGFVPRVGIRSVQFFGGHNIWLEDSFLTRIGFFGGGMRGEDWGGRLLDESAWFNINARGPWQSNAWINPQISRQRFAGEVHELRQIWSGFNFRPTGAIEAIVWGMIGEGIDFVNGRKADEIRPNATVGLRLGRRLNLRIQEAFQHLSLEGEEILTASATQLRTVYNFSPRAFLRAIVQYRVTDRNPALHEADISPERTSLDTQLLFSYKLNPLSVVFLGYSDMRDGFVRPDRTVVDLTQRDRVFFVKVGYAWRP